MNVSGIYPSSVPNLPELPRGPEALRRFSNVSGHRNLSTHFDHQSFTAAVDSPEPKFLGCIPAPLTLTAFHMIESSSTRLIRVHCRKMVAEKLPSAAKGFLEERLPLITILCLMQISHDWIEGRLPVHLDTSNQRRKRRQKP